MTILVNDRTKIVTSPCGGYEIRKLMISKTGEPVLSKKDGNQIWRFCEFWDSLEHAALSLIEGNELVSDAALDNVEQIIKAIEAAKAEVVKALKDAK